MSAEEQTYFEKPFDIYERKELPGPLFLKWWGLLAEEDRAEFRFFYQGDEILARFVCVLDYLIMQKVKGDEQGIFCLAYHIAAAPYPEFCVSMDNPAIRNRAAAAWKHPSVQALMDRVKYRATRARILRTENLLARNIEQMLEDSHQTKTGENGVEVPAYDMKERHFAAMAAIKFMELAQRGEAEVIAMRTKLGLENARKALTRQNEEVDPKVLEGYVRLAKDTFGEEKMKALLGAN